jgi:hypothetical protein
MLRKRNGHRILEYIEQNITEKGFLFRKLNKIRHLSKRLDYAL